MSTVEFVKVTPEELQSLIDHSIDIYIIELLRNNEFTEFNTAKKLALKEVLYFSDPDTPDIFCYHLLQNKEPVGYVMYCYNPQDHSSFLGMIYLYSTHREKGLARQTMEIYEDLSRQLGAHYILLYVFKTNHRAIGLYKRCGYQIAGEYALNESPVPSRYAMVKWLVDRQFKEP